jgi:protein-S-isoprenylcysteine O-methyltransferase Ste14
MNRFLTFAYGALSYALFFGAFLYLIGFLCNWMVPVSIDVGPEASLGVALLVNLALLAAFGVQHSVMARPGFKAWWTRWVPTSIERSTYVLLSTVLVIALFVFWRPIPIVVWDLTGSVGPAALWGLFGLGWAVLLASTFAIDHFDLFGLRQVFLKARGRPYTELAFQVKTLYRFVRHPIYVGWIIAFWATPTMTVGHLLLAGSWTLYILIAIQLEERDLVRAHGNDYERYRSEVPMLIPGRRARPVTAGAQSVGNS